MDGFARLHRRFAVGGGRVAPMLAVLLALLPFLADSAQAANRLTWSGNSARMSVARSGLGVAAAANGKIYAVGGDTGGPSNVTEEYDPSADLWTRKAPMSVARHHLGLAAAADGALFAVGGRGPGSYLTLLERYDPATDSWTTKAAMPTPRAYLAAAVAGNGRLYAVGGYDGMNVFNAVEEYDPASDTWTTKAPLPTPRFVLALAAAPNGKLYAVGGQGNAVIDDVDEYDPATNVWTARTAMPTARASLGLAAAANGRLYAIGGANGANVLRTVEEFDPATNSWLFRAQLPGKRSRLGVAAAPNGKLYAVGGTDGAANLSTLEEYDPASNTWTNPVLLPSLPEVRHAFPAVVANGKLYVFGGDKSADGSVASSRIDEYNPATNTWRLAMANATVGLYGTAAALAPNGKIYITGGRIGGTTVANVLEYTPPTGLSDPGTLRFAASMPGTARVDHGLVAAPNGKLYAIGGFNNANTVLNRVDEYTPPPAGGPDGTWQALSGSGLMPTARVALALALGGDGKVYAIGGQDQVGTSLTTVERFTPPADGTQQGTWEGVAAVAQLPTGRWRPTAVPGPEGTILLLGGKSGSAIIDEVVQYDPATNTWAQRAPMLLARYGLAAGLIGERLLAVGGFVQSAGVSNLGESAAVTRLPTASAGGPYSVPSGGAVRLQASGTDPEGSGLSYAWDLTGDRFYETSGQSPTFSAAGLAPGFHTVRVRAVDQSGAYGLASIPITIVTPTCANSRPNVTLTTSKPALGRLQAVIVARPSPAATANSLASVRISSVANAAVSLNGTPVTAGQVTTLPAGTSQAVLVLDRQVPGAASTVAFAATDDCGEWRSFVGGGPSAF